MTTKILLACMLTICAISLKTNTGVHAENSFGGEQIMQPLDSSIHKVIDSVTIIKSKTVVMKGKIQNKMSLLEDQQRELQALQAKLDSATQRCYDE